jgi:polyisoprenoid-binding protein YceI
LVTSIFAAVMLVVIASVASAGDAYKSDLTHSSVEFSVKHMVISNVKGTFDQFEAVINYDPDNMEKSSVDVSIDVSSIDTRDEKRDGHLKSPDFFDVENHPNITFKSDKIVKKGDGYAAVGTLTIRGVAKKIELPFQLNGPVQNPWGQTVIGIVINFELNRKDYDVKWNKTMDNGGVVVGDDVKIEINLEAKKS